MFVVPLINQQRLCKVRTLYFSYILIKAHLNQFLNNFVTYLFSRGVCAIFPIGGGNKFFIWF